MKKLKKRLLVFLLTMAMCCPLILEPLSVLADGDENAATVETEEIVQEQEGVEGSPIIPAPEFAEGLIYAEAPQRYLTAGDSFTAEPKQERFTVNSNERVTLEVITSAPAGTTLSYQWQKYHQEENGDWEPTALEGETSSTYQTEPITQYTMYNCIVRDSESHVEYVFFYITRQNHFRADAVESRVIIERGQSATIAVVASGDELDGVTYKWDHGPTTASCVVSEPGNYYCTVKDKFLNSYGVSVRVGYENHFTAWAEEPNIFVSKGGNATLKVNASGDDLTGVTYAWSQRLLVEGSTNNYRYVTLQGETGNTLPVSNITERGEYYCDVKDAYGNYSYIQFVVGINNHLSVKANQSQVSVNYGGTATLKAIATADEMDGLTYRWTRNDNTGYVFNEVTGNTFTTGAITEFESYCCTVTDKYGNIGEAYFNISVNNHFQATAETNPIKISKGGKATLKVNVSGDDITGVTYRWREVFVRQDGAGNYSTSSIPIQDATQSSYQTDALNEPKQFQCIATDRFGSDSYVNFQVVFENHFTARAEKQEQSVSPGGKATLSVNVTGDDLSKVTYRWEELVKETNGGSSTYTRRVIPNETASSLNTGAISNRKEYYCVANDGYGNEKSVWFIVDIENHFTAKAVKSKVTVASGENAELEVSCSGDDLTGITYAWYLQHDNTMPDLLEGVTSSKLILRNITQAASYQCIAQDKYGKSSYVRFTVGIENHLTLKAEKRNYYTNPGGSVELSVNASADDMTQLTYQWYEMVKDYDVDDGFFYWTERIISGATNRTYQVKNVTESKSYRCYVTDQFGNRISHDEYIYVNISNRLQARSLTHRSEYSIGECATLKVEVSATDKTGLKYQWSKYRNGYGGEVYYYKSILLEENGTDTFVTEPITESWNYRCIVTDKYGNTCEVNFAAFVENGLRNSKYIGYQVPMGSDGTAKLEMKARTNDQENVTYYWRKWGDESNNYEDEMLSAGSQNYVIVDQCGEYVCDAVDEHGHRISYWAEVISAEAGSFNAWAEGDQVKVIPNGGSATLQVETNASASEAVTYRWAYSKVSSDEFGVQSENWEELDCDKSSLVITSDMEEGDYACWAKNASGTEIYVWFRVYLGQMKGWSFSSTAGTIENGDVLWLAEGETATITVSTTGFGSGVSYHWMETTSDDDDCWDEWHLADSSNAITVTADYAGMTRWYDCYIEDAQGHHAHGYIDIKVKADCTVKFQANGGSGSMANATAQKYYEYTLPECTFTAPSNKEFAGWYVNGEIYEAGETIIAGGNVTVKATWKNTSIAATFNHSCSFQNKIEVNFKVTANLTGYDEFWLSLERQDFSGEGKECTWKTVKISKYSVDSSGRYVFTYDDIAAAEMGDLLRAKLCAKKGNVVYESNVDEYSVKEYCRGRLKNSTNDKFRKLIVDTLNYGAAAQVYFKRNTENLANNILSNKWNQEGSHGNPILTSVNEATNNGGKTAVLKNKSVSFNSGVELNLYTTYGGNAPGANVKVVVSYVNTLGNSITESVTSDKFTESPKDGVMRYRAVFTSIATPDFGQPLTIKIYDGSTLISETYTYSIETYSYNRIKDTEDENYRVLLNAMMNYSQSAKDYFKTAN